MEPESSLPCSQEPVTCLQTTSINFIIGLLTSSYKLAIQTDILCQFHHVVQTSLIISGEVKEEK